MRYRATASSIESSFPTDHAGIASAEPANGGQDTLITVDSNDSILLKNVHAASLHTSDFIVHV